MTGDQSHWFVWYYEYIYPIASETCICWIISPPQVQWLQLECPHNSTKHSFSPIFDKVMLSHSCYCHAVAHILYDLTWDTWNRQVACFGINVLVLN